jgi:hypothetical protein
MAMAYWPRVNLSASAGTFFVAGTLRAAVNSYGLIELFVQDYYGNVWHATQTRVSRPGLGPFGRPTTVAIWSGWTSFGMPVGGPNQTFPPAATFTVATNGDGRLEIIAVCRGNPYHMYQLPQPPGVVNLSGTPSWSEWTAMTQAPSSLSGLFVENFWPVAVNLAGSIVVCYLSNLQANQAIYYDYQVPDANQVGGVGWASVPNNGLFSIAVPAPADQGFFSISLVPTQGGISLLALSLLWGIRASGYYAALLTTPSGAWSPWQAVPASFAVSSYPQIYPMAALPSGVSSSVGYIPGGAAALFFSDDTGALNVLRQGLTQANPGAPINQVAWNAVYDLQLPANSIRPWPFNVAVSEDPVADANDATNLHQMALFSSSDGLSLLALNFQVPAQVPAPPLPPASAGFWPDSYNASSASPTVLDQSTSGEFTSLDQVVSIVQNGSIQVFAVTDSSANVYSWTEPV